MRSFIIAFVCTLLFVGCGECPPRPVVVKRIPSDKQQLAAAMTVELTEKMAQRTGYSPAYVAQVISKMVLDTYGEVIVIEPTPKGASK